MSNGTDTRQKILEVALDLFSRQGFHGTSIREIAQGVGIQKSSIYNHFKNKEDILIELSLSISPASIKEKLNSDIVKEKINSPYEFLKYFEKEIITILKDEKENKFLQMMLREHNIKSVRKVVMEKFLEEDRNILKNVFSQMMKKGLIIEEDPLVLANEFIGTLILFRMEYLFLSFEESDVDYFYEMAEKHVDFFWKAIRKE